MSDTAELTETFTGQVHKTPSGGLLSVWKNAQGGHFYRDRVELSFLEGSAGRGTPKAAPFKTALTAISNYKPPGYWMR